MTVEEGYCLGSDGTLEEKGYWVSPVDLDMSSFGGVETLGS